MKSYAPFWFIKVVKKLFTSFFHYFVKKGTCIFTNNGYNNNCS